MIIEGTVSCVFPGPKDMQRYLLIDNWFKI